MFKADPMPPPGRDVIFEGDMDVRTIKQFFALAIFAIAMITSSLSLAYDVNSPSAVNVDENGLALRGYDPVSYFDGTPPQRGSASYVASYNGMTFRFATAQNRDKFAASPASYAPQFGGFCETGVMLAKKLDGDPLVYRVADGKLYVYINEQARGVFLEDAVANGAKAVRNWPLIKNKKPSEL